MKNKSFISVLICFMLSTPSLAQEGGETSSQGETPAASESEEATPQGFGLRGGKKKGGKGKRKSKKRRTKRKKSRDTTSSPEPVRSKTSGSRIGFGVEGGWEAPYGNAAVFHLILNNFLDLNGGIGYNNSGLKIGGGAALLLNMTDSFALRFGGSLVRSQGRTGDVNLDAKFTPENSGASESIVASKSFTVSDALLADAVFGASFKLSDGFAIVGGGNYNVVLSGNEVTFEDETSYNKNIELTNGDEFDKEFEEEAKSVVTAGGLGFHVGIVILM